MAQIGVLYSTSMSPNDQISDVWLTMLAIEDLLESHVLSPEDREKLEGIIVLASEKLKLLLSGEPVDVESYAVMANC
jgi:hypothetical protein